MDQRILLLLTDLKIGGTPTVVRELAVRLSQAPGVYVQVACLDRRGPVADTIAAKGVAVTTLDASSAMDVSAIFRLGRLVGSRKFSTVFSFLVHANAAAAAIRPVFPRVRFIQSIQTTQPDPAWHWAVQQVVQHAAEKVVTPSPSAATFAKECAGVPEEKIVVIPNAVEMKKFSPEIAAKNVANIGFIGRLDPVKRIGDLIAAMPFLADDLKLHIFGEGEQRSEIESQIAALHLSARVVLHGLVPDSTGPLRTIDVLVLPSLAEGFGLVLIEAMAAGVPVIATNVPGIRDVVRHEQNGLLVPAKNPAALAAAIDRLRADGGLRKSLIAGGISTVRDRFTWDRVFPAYRELLRI